MSHWILCSGCQEPGHWACALVTLRMRIKSPGRNETASVTWAPGPLQIWKPFRMRSCPNYNLPRVAIMSNLPSYPHSAGASIPGNCNWKKKSPHPEVEDSRSLPFFKKTTLSPAYKSSQAGPVPRTCLSSVLHHPLLDQLQPLQICLHDPPPAFHRNLSWKFCVFLLNFPSLGIVHPPHHFHPFLRIP